MKIGIIDDDGGKWPNLALMKLSAWHKQLGDEVEWYMPLLHGHVDIAYEAKVFTFNKDFESPIYADAVVRGGSGFYHTNGGDPLPNGVEHIYPDYSIYGIKDTAYGFLTRGCPRGCSFCIVGEKDGRRSRKVADLNEFWNGQKNITLLDPNFFACKEWPGLAEQLIRSGAYIDFNQGIDVRVITEDMCEALRDMRIKCVHCAWDRPEDEEYVLRGIDMLKRKTGLRRQKIVCYVLTNYDTTFEQDIHRVMTLRDLGVDPYVMIYQKESLPRGHKLKAFQRWVNAKCIFMSCETFDEYTRKTR